MQFNHILRPSVGADVSRPPPIQRPLVGVPYPNACVQNHYRAQALSKETPMPKRIDHVAIIVRDIEQALVFYRDTLGIVPGVIKEVPTEQVRIAFLPMGGPGGSEIELIQPTTPDSSLAKYLEKRGEGLHHICLEVDDIN